MADSNRGLPLGPMMVDVAGTRLSSADRKLLGQPAVGAVILFSRNYESPKQVTELVAEIKSLRSPALLVAVDQEGGRVQRFRDGFFRLPAMHSFATVFDENPEQGAALCESAGYLMASEILATGIDFSFAPVLDCANLKSRVIGDRGFHQSPESVVALAGAFIRGMNCAGMSATGKHFPGHGGVVEDSHYKLPVDTRSLQEMQSRDLVPFRRLAGQLHGIMTAHVDFPNIDGSLPTYSAFWLKTILREQFGFDGVIFSDDLTMKGAHGAGSVFRRTRAALQAGCDMALICNDAESANQVVDELGNTAAVNPQRLERMRGRAPMQTRDLASLKLRLAQFA